MKKHILLLTYILSVIIFSGCTEKLYTSVDILRPAKVTFPLEANKLLIINNSATQPIDYGHKTELLNEKAKNIKLNTDSLSVFCVTALAEELGDKYFFKSIVLVPTSVNKNNYFFTLAPLKADTIAQLCKQYNANVVLSLDRIKVNDKISEYFLGTNTGTDKPYVSNLEVKYETVWTLHYPAENAKQSTVLFRDTLYWENESAQKKYIQSGLPKRYDALIDGALYAGRNSVKKFVPWWDKADRYFFNSKNKKIKQGMDSVYVKNWPAAISIWKELYTKTKSNYLKAIAANNIAVCLEITGEIDEAYNYATNSMKLFENITYTDYSSYLTLSNYCTELKIRKQEIQALKQQLGD